MSEYKIAVIKGDGIGPEVTDESINVLDIIAKKFDHRFNYKYALAGGCAIDSVELPLPNETIDICKSCDAVILGAVGGPKWDGLPSELRPERALLSLRSELDLYCNLRPAFLFTALKDASPLKPNLLESGFDVMIVRELTGGIYFGEKGIRNGIKGKEAYDIECYSESEIKRIAHMSFELAKKRNKKITSVDKANVLESSKLWRKIINEISIDYPDITVEHMYVDNAAMQLIKNPSNFDIILTSNMFGDILSDEASIITGSIGMLPSASLNGKKFGMYEPIHGSAPDISGKNIANPIASILSVAMMLKYSFNLNKEAKCIEDAVEKILNSGYRTPDIFSEGLRLVGTKEMGDLIVQEIYSK